MRTASHALVMGLAALSVFAPAARAQVVYGLGTAGAIVARAGPTASTHLILDVNGYFE
jgi:hypothetical protein